MYSPVRKPPQNQGVFALFTFSEVFLVTHLPSDDADADADCRLRRQFIHRYVR